MSASTPSKHFALAPTASTGFSNASAYDAHRPSYPPAAVDSLLAHVDIAGRHHARLVEVGAGTGKFTELMAARDEEYDIVAVEPHAGMRGELQKKNLGQGGRVKVVDGNAEDMPVEEGWGDACIVAQAFHWFATEEALREIHRALRPGAVLGLIWNIEDYNAPVAWPVATPWEKKLKDLMWSMDDGHDRFRHQKFKHVFEAQQKSTPLQTLVDTFKQNMPMFSLPLGEEIIPWTVWLTDEGIWERYLTISYIANSQGQERQRIKQAVFDAMKGEGVERNEKGEIALHGVTALYWTSRV